jgi:hypothetical protein
MAGCYEHDIELSDFLEGGEYYDQLADYQISLYHSLAVQSLVVRCGCGLST